MFFVIALEERQPLPVELTGLELLLLSFTVLALTLLTEHSTRRSSDGVLSLISSTKIENRTLIEESKTHWADQKSLMDEAIKALTRLAALQLDLITSVRELGITQRAAVELQAKDVEARETARLQEIEKQRPILTIEVQGWEGHVIKHFVIWVTNDGPPGSDLDVTFSFPPVFRRGSRPIISKGQPLPFDFGDINEYVDTGRIDVICEVSNSLRNHRYRYAASFDYTRNRGFWGSQPVVTQSGQQAAPTLLF